MQSPEHEFLSNAALEIMRNASRSGLFTYKEGSRKLFDFSCDLEKDWSKKVSGQTLWKHNRDGIDKDIRTFLTDTEASATVYVAMHTTANMTRVSEVVGAYRNTVLRDQLTRLRIFWIPSDFDADDEKGRAATYKSLQEDITRDLLLHVVLEGLTADDLTRFAISPRPGCPLAILSYLKAHDFQNLKYTSDALSISTSILKEETLRLFIIGALESDHLMGGKYGVSKKGNAILDVCARLRDYIFESAAPNPEFMYVARLLGIDFDSIQIHNRGHIDIKGEPLQGGNSLLKFDAENSTTFLMNHVYAAEKEGTVEWRDPYFTLPTIL